MIRKPVYLKYFLILVTDVESNYYSSPIPECYVANLKTGGYVGDLGVNGRFTLDIKETRREDVDRFF